MIHVVYMMRVTRFTLFNNITNHTTKLMTTHRYVSAITLMMLLLLGAIFTDSSAIFTDSRRAASSRSTSGMVTPLRRDDRIALGGMKSGAPSPHTPSS